MNNSDAFLQRGSETIFMDVEMPQGNLQFGASQWTIGDDRAFVARGKMRDWNFCRSLFSYDDDSVVFCRMQDRDHSTTLLMADGSPGIMNVTVTHDNDSPNFYEVDIFEFMKSGKLPQSTNGEEIDFVGRRRPPEFTSKELYSTVKDVPEYMEFRRGNLPGIAQPMPLNPEPKLSKCALICLIPGCGIFCLFWFKKKKDKPKAIDLASTFQL